ncbi:Ras-GEF domain-containing family member 1B, partial [Cyphomyrmex costatus]
VDITELCPSATVLAQQLTHVELERLSYIGPEEFVQAFAKESPHLETSFKDMKKTRNLESYVQWFNRLSYFVATEVCKHAKKKQRVRVVEYWIETARECFNIGNFNSLMAIIAGLNMSPISRLKKTVRENIFLFNFDGIVYIIYIIYCIRNYTILGKNIIIYIHRTSYISIKSHIRKL